MRSICFTTRQACAAWLLAILAFGIPAPCGRVLAQEEASGGLSGLVLDPAGNPAAGFRLVFRGEDGQERVSAPSDDLGRYRISLNPGTSYQLVAALAPDGTRLEVPELPPLPVEEGVRRLDVRIRPESRPPGVQGQGAREIPWWQIGGAAAAAIVLYAAVWSDDPEASASPFEP
jgi:hypothetical protein